MLNVTHLTKRFGKFTAVDDVSFSVTQGEVFAFLGPNGSGKTTTMKSIVGLIVPPQGTVSINEFDVHLHPTMARQCISYLPQRVSFPESLSAREIMRFYGRMRNLSKEIADRALAETGLNGSSDKPVQEFSGGMVQRLGLAIVAMPDAPVLLLDEPTANLDPQGVIRFRKFIQEQKAKGKTIIFSTHLLGEVEQLADRAGIFIGGKLIAQESIEGLRTAYAGKESIEDMYLAYMQAHNHETE